MIKNNNKEGFTLIELLVVIAIIGLLSTLSILALNTARARARDTKRVADVKQIQTALEMYYNEWGQYPTSSDIIVGASIGTGTNTYLKSIPKPPTPTDNSTACGTAPQVYTYTSYNLAGAGTYTLQYCLGAAVADIPAGLRTASQSGMK